MNGTQRQSRVGAKHADAASLAFEKDGVTRVAGVDARGAAGADVSHAGKQSDYKL